VTNFAQRERRTLADELARVGHDAPTLCEGWRAEDLAAHLVIRERRPDAGPGLVIGALAGHTERVQERVKRRRSFSELVDAIRRGPPFPLRLRFIDEPMNTAEYFVHNEDVRRAQQNWEPRELDPQLERALWSRLKMMARSLGRHAAGGLVLEAPGFGSITAKSGAPLVTISGPPGEILLLAFGRQAAARVTWEGDRAGIEAITSAKLGI
jgi:uncharacterized protein (TIGR03085 family)